MEQKFSVAISETKLSDCQEEPRCAIQEPANPVSKLAQNYVVYEIEDEVDSLDMMKVNHPC